MTADNRKAVAGADIVVLAVKPNQFSKVAASLKGNLQPQPDRRFDNGRHDPERSCSDELRPRSRRSRHAEPAGTGRRRDERLDRDAGGRRRGPREGAATAPGRGQGGLRSRRSGIIDMATAVSGSGAGFVFLLIEAFIDGAVHLGLPATWPRRDGRADVRWARRRWWSNPASRRRTCAP